MNCSMFVDMVCNEDVTDYTLKPVEIKSIRYICNGNAAFVIYVQDQIFKYKGTANEGEYPRYCGMIPCAHSDYVFWALLTQVYFLHLQQTGPYSVLSSLKMMARSRSLQVTVAPDSRFPRNKCIEHYREAML